MSELKPELVLAMRQALRYEKHTGIVYWRKRPKAHFPKLEDWVIWNKRFSGKEVGSIKKNKKKYFRGFEFRSKFWVTHRAIWVIVTGQMPVEIDHINGNSLDNRWINLRNVTRQQNMRNMRSRGRDLPTGVFRRGIRFGAQINPGFSGNKWLGTFDSLEQAVAARKSAERLLNFHPNHGQVRPL